ncbi:hypothetical protein [Nostoc sp.]|uniref:hypothetical protein n=1 Tax=Nostoc sp. TaxID=1180 RepID=UPI002FF03B8D
MLFSFNILQKLPEAIAFGQNPKIVQLRQRQGTGEELWKIPTEDRLKSPAETHSEGKMINKIIAI